MKRLSPPCPVRSAISLTVSGMTATLENTW
jgi:hypothetical protein